MIVPTTLTPTAHRLARTTSTTRRSIYGFPLKKLSWKSAPLQRRLRRPAAARTKTVKTTTTTRRRTATKNSSRESRPENRRWQAWLCRRVAGNGGPSWTNSSRRGRPHFTSRRLVKRRLGSTGENSARFTLMSTTTGAKNDFLSLFYYRPSDFVAYLDMSLSALVKT